MKRFAGQVALLTGAAGGIGRATALRLASEGAHVVALDLGVDGLRDTCAAVEADGGSAQAFIANVTHRTEMTEIVEKIVAEFERIDVLVNNAGIVVPSPFLETTDDLWNRTLSINLTGYFIVGQIVAREMAKRKGGRIVNVASLSGHIANDKQAAYASSKGGVIALTRAMAFELAPLNIGVNAVSPGPIETNLSREFLSPEARRRREERIPQGRLGQPEEVAAAIAFLASSDAAYINGEAILIDGGLLTGGIRG